MKCNVQNVHLTSVIHDELQAKSRAQYSTVNSSTKLVSTPNHTLGEIEWKLGTVSRMVTIAEKMMRDVDAKCTRKAEDEEVGRSRSSKAACFLGDLMGSGPSSKVAELGNISSTLRGECGRVSSVRNRAATDDMRASGIDRDMRRKPLREKVIQGLEVMRLS